MYAIVTEIPAFGFIRWMLITRWRFGPLVFFLASRTGMPRCKWKVSTIKSGILASGAALQQYWSINFGHLRTLGKPSSVPSNFS
jgi:hypothetical protein